MKRKTEQASKTAPVYQCIRLILESARRSVARSVNTTQVVANWLIGREIVEEEQKGLKRAGYGQRLILGMSNRLTAEFGRGFAIRNLESFRAFYLEYPDLVPNPHALRANLEEPTLPKPLHADIRKSSGENSHSARAELSPSRTDNALSRNADQCGSSSAIG